MAKVKLIKHICNDGVERNAVIFRNPALGYDQVLPLNIWTWNGDTEKPTIRASVLTTGTDFNGTPYRMHCFVTDGKIEYLSDTTIEGYAGKTIDMVDLYIPKE